MVHVGNPGERTFSVIILVLNVSNARGVGGWVGDNKVVFGLASISVCVSQYFTTCSIAFYSWQV